MKEIGLNSVKLLLFLFSIFFGGFMFVFIVTKLCFKKKKSPEHYPILEEPS